MPPTPLRSGGGSIEFDMALSLLAVERRIRTATRADETGRRGRVRSVRYGENPARREDPEKFEVPFANSGSFGEIGRLRRLLGSRLCPVGHVVCAAALAAVTSRGKPVTARGDGGKNRGSYIRAW